MGSQAEHRRNEEYNLLMAEAMLLPADGLTVQDLRFLMTMPLEANWPSVHELDNLKRIIESLRQR